MRANLLALLSVGVLGLSHPVLAQSGDDLLPRRGYFGVGVEKADGGARVFSVATDSTAAAADVRIGDVIEAIEGPISVNACLDHELGCDQMPRCTMIGVWSEVQRNITEVLSRTTIAGLQRTPCHELISSSSLSSAA